VEAGAVNSIITQRSGRLGAGLAERTSKKSKVKIRGVIRLISNLL
jgi:hypothetical protein